MSMNSTPVPITLPASRRVISLSSYGLHENVFQNNVFGAGHQGPDIMTRIKMSLQSEITSEVEWAILMLSQVSCTSPGLINFEKTPLLGHELIRYFVKPYMLLSTQRKPSQSEMLRSIDCLLSLRNLVQDLSNQQWLSQVKGLRSHLAEILKFLCQWFYGAGAKPYHLIPFNDQFREVFNYTLDLIEPLSCYYIDTSKNDALFHYLQVVLLNTRDRYMLISTINSLTHLLYVRDIHYDGGDEDQKAQIPSNDEGGQEKPLSNCIDAIGDRQLEIITDTLLISDHELNVASLEFLVQYLSSEALHPSFPDSWENSSQFRLKKLLRLSSSNCHTLLKQLPILIVSNLSLKDPSKLPRMPHIPLTKRSTYNNVPAVLPLLSKELYDVIVKFPEPLRATTWLRCCYEPYFDNGGLDDSEKTKTENTDVVPGEVTQISLWKAYEKQFEEVWKNFKTNSNPEWPSLLPAVEFIKNVNSAFPNSEAMVVNLNDETNEESTRKKFIIKGIQPRQHVVNIDVANYDALRSKPNVASQDSVKKNLEEISVGHIDFDKFYHDLNSINDSILSGAENDPKGIREITAVNVRSHELLERIIANTFRARDEVTETLKYLFRLYNTHWLADVVFANPGLVEKGLINSDWLQYLI